MPAAVRVNDEDVTSPCLLVGANDIGLGAAELHLW